ncbi:MULTISPECIES: Cro/CI family transcriptional regulator [Acinetobacter]|uniref:Cro/CI family transcriptional regulator n=1 Tax=Acinetobacter TaxID=469 RepID=UPI001F22FCB9|nr:MULTISPECIES: Cro/CI family transcriptional regulator [Acinetobacter]MDV2483317.1 Cro/CI family transcriptional regulator [Acinetobacter towneri]UIZ56317.1 Cro/CI family transcriptional regulator [Acinetobacter sp. SCLZS86]
MTKNEAFELLQVNGVELANLLGIEPSAVYQWAEDKIPLAREYQILDLAKGKKPITVERKSPQTTH